jgi:hypothetical protein
MTPTMISARAVSLTASIRSPKAIVPIAAMAAVPRPVHAAAATETDMFLVTTASSQMEMP